MPTPVGHALAGYAAGTLVAGRPGRRGVAVSGVRGRILLFGTLACLPDIDLLFGTHSTYTHSVGAVFLVALAAAAFRIPASIIAACAVAYGSHLLLDWLGHDTSAPIGIMALWPFSSEHYSAPYPIFSSVSRRYWLPGFWIDSLRVVLREVLVFGSLALAAHLFRGRATGTPAPVALRSGLPARPGSR